MTIVTVHGTFARNWLIRKFYGGRGWWHANSYFCQKLLEKIPGCAFVEFEWSGKNSHSARIAAGAELARLLTLIRREKPNENVVVIAHSHGGNVALKAIDVAEPGSVLFLFLLGMPHLSIFCQKPVACDSKVEGVAHTCGGTTCHWLYWGDAVNRVGNGIWGFYSLNDAVQGFVARVYTGLPLRMKLRLPGKLEVMRHYFPPDCPGITNIVVDMKSRERVGLLGRLIHWDAIKEHNALHSRAMAVKIAEIIATK
jgi:hypothetical protein